MKKLLVTILAAACVLSLTACPANVKPETSTEETTAVTTEETETETTTTEETTTETTATDPVDTSSTEETTSSSETTPVVTPTVTPAPKATVTSQVKKTFKKDGTNYKYEIPKVTIPGKSTSAVNKKIKKALSKYSYKGSEPYAMKYTYYVNSKIVSILVNVYDTEIDHSEYYAYNISVKTGKLIKDKEVLKLYGVSSKKFLSMVKSTYKKGGYWAGKGSEAKKNIKKSLKKVSYKYLDPYVGSNGHLCFLGYVYYYGGAGEGYTPFDAVKKKQVTG